MANETEFAVINADGTVENVIIAAQSFVDSLPAALADPSTDTGDLSPDQKLVEVTARDPRPGPGWTRGKNGKFTAPPLPPQTPAPNKHEATAVATATEADDAFLADALRRVRRGESLTQDERDRVALIQLVRTR